MQKVNIAFVNTTKLANERATEFKKNKYNTMIADIENYIDARLDMLEKKFLVFECNQSEYHWVSVVVINPFLVVDQYLPKVKDAYDLHRAEGEEDDFVGRCVLNSNGSTKEREENGLQGTQFTTNQASYGVWFFLNLCASYLNPKSKMREMEKR
jgi:flagellar assembly factor FliW